MKPMSLMIRAVAVSLCGACTTLGPMPTTTAISAIPSARAGAEVQAGIVPAYYLSSTARDPDNAEATGQLAAVVDPAELLGLPGLIVGARVWGEGGDTPVEPMVGYRRKLTPAVAIAGIAYGTRASATEQDASYEATRAGGELAIDAELLTSEGGWFALHGQAAASATYLAASGTYCVGSTGVAVDCPENNPTPIMGELSGMYPAATGTLALDFARGKDSAFHHARLAFHASAAVRPRIRNGEQEAGDVFATIGMTLTLGFGDAK